MTRTGSLARTEAREKKAGIFMRLNAFSADKKVVSTLPPDPDSHICALWMDEHFGIETYLILCNCY